MTSLQEIKKRLVNNNWLGQLPGHVVEELALSCHVKSLTQGQLLFAKGDNARGLYCVLSGKMRVSSFTTDGKEALLTWLEAGEWFGEISLFDGLPRTHDSHAQIDSQVLVVPSSEFTKLLSNYPELYQHVVISLCQKLRQSFTLLEGNASLSTKGQLARRLILLCNNPTMSSSRTVSNQETTLTRITVSQESIASMLNTSRQTVNKLLQELQKKQIITLHYGHIDIIDMAQLETLTVR
jgi:CRP-like cAMP-binding protein